MWDIGHKVSPAIYKSVVWENPFQDFHQGVVGGVGVVGVVCGVSVVGGVGVVG